MDSAVWSSPLHKGICSEALPDGGLLPRSKAGDLQGAPACRSNRLPADSLVRGAPGATLLRINAGDSRADVAKNYATVISGSR